MNKMNSSKLIYMLREMTRFIFAIVLSFTFFFPSFVTASRVDFNSTITNGNIVTDSFSVLPITVPGMFVTTEFVNNAAVTLAFNPTQYSFPASTNIESVDLFFYNSTAVPWSQLTIEFIGLNPDILFPASLIPRIYSPHQGSYSLDGNKYTVNYSSNDIVSSVFSFKLGGGIYQFPELQETAFQIKIKPLVEGGSEMDFDESSPVPVPSAIWFFATGLMGLSVNFMRKQREVGRIS